MRSNNNMIGLIQWFDKDCGRRHHLIQQRRRPSSSSFRNRCYLIWAVSSSLSCKFVDSFVHYRHDIVCQNNFDGRGQSITRKQYYYYHHHFHRHHRNNNQQAGSFFNNNQQIRLFSSISDDIDDDNNNKK